MMIEERFSASLNLSVHREHVQRMYPLNLLSSTVWCLRQNFTAHPCVQHLLKVHVPIMGWLHPWIPQIGPFGLYLILYFSMTSYGCFLADCFIAVFASELFSLLVVLWLDRDRAASWSSRFLCRSYKHFAYVCRKTLQNPHISISEPLYMEIPT